MITPDEIWEMLFNEEERAILDEYPEYGSDIRAYLILNSETVIPPEQMAESLGLPYEIAKRIDDILKRKNSAS